MSRRQQHTHRGHCQACGALQAIEAESPQPDSLRAGRIAKHGYKVTWGFFSGVCKHSGKPALEFDRTHCDDMCRELLEYAITMDTQARKLRAHDGMLAPKSVVTGTTINPEYLNATDRRRVPTHIDVRTPWCDCTTEIRTRWFESAARDAEGNARSARRHRQFMRELAERVHGTEPQAVDRSVKREPKVGDEFKRYDTRWRVVGEVVTSGWGRRTTKYVRCLRLDNNREADMRVQDVRKAIEEKRT